MPAVKKYTRVNFQNYPSTSTPLNATNLNKMDKGIDDLDDDLVTVKNAIENMSFDADAISYDNTQSGLQATDVQGAVDEINDNLTASNQTAGVTNVPFRFGCTDDGKFGYIINQGGADSVIPFSGSLEKLGIKSGYMAKLYSTYSFSAEQIPNSLTPASNENAFYIFNFDEKYSLMNMSNGYPEISIVKKDGTVVSIRSGNNDISDAVIGVMFNYNHSTTFTFTAK